MKRKTGLELLVTLVVAIVLLVQEYRRIRADELQMKYTSYIHGATTIPDAPAETWER